MSGPRWRTATNLRRSAPAITALAICLSTIGAMTAVRAQSPANFAIPTVDPSWDVTRPRGDTRTIDFQTREGTWMSVDVTPDGGQLVFDLLGHIYRLPATGGEATCLTQDSGIALNYQPAVSPDGTQIAFVSDRGGQDNLWVMDIDGRNVRPLALDPAARFAEPTWSADGSEIYVVKREATLLGYIRSDDRLWAIGLDGRQRPLVLESASGDGIGMMTGAARYAWPAPTRDGRKLYFGYSNFDGTDRQIRRLDLRTGSIESITHSKTGLNTLTTPNIAMQLGEAGAQPSPDSRWLAFIRKVPGASASYGRLRHEPMTALWIRSLETGEERVLAAPITIDMMGQHPPWAPSVAPGYAWAPDGQSVYFSADGGLRRVWLESGRIDVVPFDARVLRTISQMARRDAPLDRRARFAPRLLRWPVATRDGARRAYEAGGKLFVEAGSTRRMVDVAVPQDAFPMTPAWSPDGRTLAFVAFKGPRDGGLMLWTDGVVSRVSAAGGVYHGPVFGRDGRTLFVWRWPPELDWASESSNWLLEAIDLATGAQRTIASSLPANRLSVTDDGRLFFTERRGRADIVLVSIGPDGSERREHALLRAAPQSAVVSPDGRWLAVEQRQDVYAVPLPVGGAAPVLPVIDIKEPSAGVRRVSRDGGWFPSWAGPRALNFASAGTWREHDIETGKTRDIELRGRLERRRASEQQRIAFANVRILTMRERAVIERGAVVVGGDRILCVGTCDLSGVDRVIDASGRTLMPGIFDVHCHAHRGDPRGFVAPRRAEQAVYLAHGITTCFDPANGERKWSVTVGDMIEGGALVGPRTFTTTEPLRCGEDGVDDQNVRPILTLDDAREHVLRKQRLGVPSVKDFRLCLRAQRQMVVAAARESNLTVTAEAGDLFWNLGLIMGGHAGWEHWITIAPLYRDVTEFLGRAGMFYSPNLYMSEWPFGSALEYYMGQEDLWRNARLRTWYPWQALAARRSFVRKPLEQYMLPLIAQGAADIKRAGGHVVTGGHGEVHGLGTHWEIWSFALAMSPMEALEGATLDSAKFLGMERDTGSIEVGKLADFVVLDANPLEDIRHTLALRYVVLGGVVRETESLDEIWPSVREFGARAATVQELLRPRVQDGRATH